MPRVRSPAGFLLPTQSEAYNTEIRTIPGRWWRAVLYPDAQPMQNFTVAEETTKVPEVKF